jgi:hypothetical protein
MSNVKYNKKKTDRLLWFETLQAAHKPDSKRRVNFLLVECFDNESHDASRALNHHKKQQESSSNRRLMNLQISTTIKLNPVHASQR